MHGSPSSALTQRITMHLIIIFMNMFFPIGTEDQIADLFTKALIPNILVKHCAHTCGQRILFKTISRGSVKQCCNTAHSKNCPFIRMDSLPPWHQGCWAGSHTACARMMQPAQSYAWYHTTLSVFGCPSRHKLWFAPPWFPLRSGSSSPCRVKPVSSVIEWECRRSKMQRNYRMTGLWHFTDAWPSCHESAILAVVTFKHPCPTTHPFEGRFGTNGTRGTGGRERTKDRRDRVARNDRPSSNVHTPPSRVTMAKPDASSAC